MINIGKVEMMKELYIDFSTYKGQSMKYLSESIIQLPNLIKLSLKSSIGSKFEE